MLKFFKELLGIKRFFVEERFYPDIRPHIAADVANIKSFKNEKRIRMTVHIEPVYGKDIKAIWVHAVKSSPWIRKLVDFLGMPWKKKTFFNDRIVSAERVLINDHFSCQIDAEWDESCVHYELYASYEPRIIVGPLMVVNPTAYEKHQKYIEDKTEILDSIPMPPGDLIYVTQGMRDVDSYKASILPGMDHYRKVFEEVGFDSSKFHRILDFGCGTGRQLSGWYADNPDRELYGVDYNKDLIDWANSNLPANMRFSVDKLNPPLDFEDNFFDCIYLISVFTHLALENQYEWLNEFRRILKPGQPLLISLHGQYFMGAYRVHRPEEFEAITRSRYRETVNGASQEGSNNFNTIHMPDFAINTLFRDWKVLGHFPGGFVRGERIEPGLTYKQDIYIVTY